MVINYQLKLHSLSFYCPDRDLTVEVILFHLQERLNQVLMEKKKESRSGMEIMNLLQVIIHLLQLSLLVYSVVFLDNIISINRKKVGNVGHGTGRRPTMTSTKKLCVTDFYCLA